MNRIYKALILNEPYAQWVKEGKKLIETRMKAFKHRGDLIICCDKGKSKGSPNAGKAICMVDLWKVRVMRDSDVEAACIHNAHKRMAYLLKDWRHFNRDFSFTFYARTTNWQGLFDLELPKDVLLVPRPDIIPFREYLTPQEAYKLVKEDDAYDYLDFGETTTIGRFDVWIGKKSDTPIESFDTYDSAQKFVDKTHEIINRINSARLLRSFF